MRNFWLKCSRLIIFLLIGLVASTADRTLEKREKIGKVSAATTHHQFSLRKERPKKVLRGKQSVPVKDREAYSIGPQFLWMPL